MRSYWMSCRWSSVLPVVFCCAMLFSSNCLSLQAEETETAASDSATQEGYLFQFKFKPNQKVSYKVLYEMTHTTRKGTLSETAFNSSETLKHYEVQKTEDSGNSTLVSFIDEVQMQVKFNEGEPVKFDSRSEDSIPPQFTKIKRSVGVPLAETEFTNSGKVLQVRSLQQKEKAKSVTPGEIKTASATDDSEETSNADSEEARSAGNYLIEFPEHALKIDEEWSKSFTVPVQVDKTLTQKVKLKRTYRLRSVNENVAHLTFKTSILSPIHNPLIMAQLIQNTPSGEVDFDLERGLILRRVAKLDNTEFGFSGDNSSMRAVSLTEEKLVNVE